MLRQLVFACFVLIAAPAARAQVVEGSAIRIQPFPPTSWAPKSEVEVTTVHNYYGRCGSTVIQVLGVVDQVENFFTVDSGSDNTRIVVIAEGGQRSLVLKGELSDYNGVACLVGGSTPFLLVWSNCAGSACGDDFTFTVVDVEKLRKISGPTSACDAQCAYRLTGDRLPLELNRRDR